MRTRMLGVLAAAFGAAALLWVCSSPAAAKKDEKEKPAGGEILSIVETDCNLTDEQKEKVGKLKEEKEKAVAARLSKIEDAKGKVSGMKDKKQREQAEAQIKMAVKSMEGYERSWDSKVVPLLKADQKVILFNKWLDNRVREEFDGISFTEEQSTKLKELCEKTAKGAAAGSDVPRAQLTGVYKTVATTILEKDQRETYLKARSAEMKKHK